MRTPPKCPHHYPELGIAQRVRAHLLATMQQVDGVLLEMPCAATQRGALACWTQGSTDPWRRARPGRGTLLPPPLGPVHQLFAFFYPLAPAPESYWLTALERLVRHPRPVFSYCCCVPRDPARCTVGGRRTVRVRWAVPIESATWTGHSFQLYWRARHEHHWRMVPLEDTFHYMDKGCVWVEGVVGRGRNKSQDPSLKSQDSRLKT
ncbi:MAG: hypothetical protein IPJ76_02770 [Flavobacteriales bacterium]|nr:MAG: hypothetical protein IPJ76_02770 [Flavobacteriales bacterium]